MRPARATRPTRVTLRVGASHAFQGLGRSQHLPDLPVIEPFVHAIPSACALLEIAPMVHEAALTTSIRDHFLADHERLQVLFERLLSAFEANDREDMSRLWTAFESGLLAHMEMEETYLIPTLQHESGRALLEEHGHFRTRLSELGVALDLHAIRLETARALVDELRAHARIEDELLYQWADERLGERDRASLFDAVATRLRATTGWEARPS